MNSWKKWLLRTAIAFAVLYTNVLTTSSQNQVSGIIFSFEEWIYNDVVFPYREAVIATNKVSQKPALVIYLHGGPKRGNDNVRQMSEKAIAVIANYLNKKDIHAVMIVPQCPDSLTWGARTNEAVKALIDKYVNEDKIDAERIYLLGGSMGGTGTWLMASAYPYLFAAVISVAGNPETADANLVASTPVYAVMGTDDRLMTIPRVSQFVEQIRDKGGEALLDVEKGWSHVKTCNDSYTQERLDWIFEHKRSYY